MRIWLLAVRHGLLVHQKIVLLLSTSMAGSLVMMNALLHGFGASFDVPGQKSVNWQCCLETVINGKLSSDEAKNGNRLGAQDNGPGRGGERDSWSLENCMKSEEPMDDVASCVNVATVNDARASATDTMEKKDMKGGVPDACQPGAWDAGPGQDAVLMGRTSDQKNWKKRNGGDDVGSVNLNSAQDDDPGWAGNHEPRSLVKREKEKEGWTVFVTMFLIVKLWRCLEENEPSRRAVRSRRHLPRRASDLGLFVLVFAVLLAVCKGQFYQPPGYSNVEEMTKDLKKLTKENKQIRDDNSDLKSQIAEMAEQLTELRAADEAEKAKQEYDKLPFWVKWFNVWYEPLPDEEEEVKEEELKGCTTIKCCLLHIIGRLMDWAWLFASDPISLFEKITKKLSGAFESQIKFLSAILGAALVFIGMNITVYAATKFAELCEQIRKLMKFLMKLPLVAFMLDASKKFAKWVLTTSDVVRSQEVADKVERKVDILTEALQKIVDIVEKPDEPGPSSLKQKKEPVTKRCTYCGAEGHARTTCPREKYDSLKCTFCGRRGHLEKDCRQKMFRPLPQRRRFEEKPPQTSSVIEEKKKDEKPEVSRIVCDFCGLNHKKENCLKNKAVKKKTGLDIVQESKREDGGSSSGSEGSATVLMIRNKDVNSDVEDERLSPEKERLIYAPISFEGVKFSSCLLDTGAQVNLMPAREVSRHGFPYRRDGIRAVRGFDGSPGRILGTVMGQLSIGRGESVMTEFLVSPDVTKPIVGIGALASMGMSIDCATRELINNRTGDILLCTVVIGEKN